MTTGKNIILCGTCKKQDCKRDYPDGIPAWCEASQFHEILDDAKTKYAEPQNRDIYVASGAVVRNGYGKWPRVQEAIEFAKELKVQKVGLVSCLALINEMQTVSQLFSGAGFEVVSSACQIGRVKPEDRGFKLEHKDYHGLMCNPITQAEICNAAGTELNYIIGLCLGHDILFQRHSKAPSSVLIVKDRVTGHNPVVVLYADGLRKSLFDTYCRK